MNRLKRSLSLRSSKRHIPESVRPQIWENDSYKVRNGGVSFPVKVFVLRPFLLNSCLFVNSWKPCAGEYRPEESKMEIISRINLKAYFYFSTLDPSRYPSPEELKFAQRLSGRWRRYKKPSLLLIYLQNFTELKQGHPLKLFVIVCPQNQ